MLKSRILGTLKPKKVKIAVWFLKRNFLQTSELTVKKIVGILGIVASFVESDETTTVVENVSILGRVDGDEIGIY